MDIAHRRDEISFGRGVRVFLSQREQEAAAFGVVHLFHRGVEALEVGATGIFVALNGGARVGQGVPRATLRRGGEPSGIIFRERVHIGGKRPFVF